MNLRGSLPLCKPLICAQTWHFAFNWLSYRQRWEHTVFNRLQIIPGLEEYHLNSEASEVTEIAELVFIVLTPMSYHYHDPYVPYSWWRESPVPNLMTQRSERSHFGLDCSSWAISLSFYCTKCQDWSRFQSWAYRGSFMSCRYGLVQFEVSLTFPMCYGSNLW